MFDITKHLSDLNLKLQGKDQIITNMCDQVNAFKCKLVLWEKQLKNEDLMHFPTCNMYKSSLGETASYQKYAEKVLSLRNEFETRFSDFKSLEGKFTLFSSIFSINIESVPNHMQMEVIDIQCDSDLKGKFIEVGVSEFYKYLPARFENTRKLAYEIMSMFGSTYRCEQLFSLMKGNKSPIRSRITDVHLGQLRLDTKPYEEAQRTLEELFPDKTDTTYAKFFATKSQHYSTLEEYFRTKATLGIQLNLPRPVIIDALTEGLPTGDQRLVRVVPPKSLSEWYELTSRVRENFSPQPPRGPDNPPRMEGPYHNTPRPPPRAQNYAAMPPSPCKFCQEQHWHSQCQRRPASNAQHGQTYHASHHSQGTFNQTNNGRQTTPSTAPAAPTTSNTSPKQVENSRTMADDALKTQSRGRYPVGDDTGPVHTDQPSTEGQRRGRLRDEEMGLALGVYPKARCRRAETKMYKEHMYK
ncbi:GTF2IRD2 [Cordylochernes scorpioides]|uniref:GTF2IRD2 n=1 Tax=Cordylochernes scorpioides TaxID=51811 RepID=A0ABY6KJW8_9ARAC|nr:GTF2IRD2 [Cordylochernes scorpioides]